VIFIGGIGSTWVLSEIQNNIIVIYEIKSFYVTLAAENFFPNNIHRANYHFTHSKNLKTPIIPPYYRWVVLCTVKDLAGGVGEGSRRWRRRRAAEVEEVGQIEQAECE
jgi:hypothetical protein